LRTGFPRRERWLAEQAELGYSLIASARNVADWESTEAAFAKVKNEVGRVCRQNPHAKALSSSGSLKQTYKQRSTELIHARFLSRLSRPL
jgi:hypothetical protein